MILVFILFTTHLIEHIPIGVLTGLMFCVVYKTFYWRTFLILSKLAWSEIFIITLVTLVTIFYNLAIAIILGVTI